MAKNEKLEKEKKVEEKHNEEKLSTKEMNEEKPENVLLLEDKIKNLENQIKLVQADNINYKKRKEEEVGNLLRYANKDLILDLLPIVDNFERALDYAKGEEFKSYTEGFKMLYDSLRDILNKYGIKKIEALGKKFDPNYHDALMVKEDKNKKEGEILEVFKEGYSLHDRVIRHSQVMVNKLK